MIRVKICGLTRRDDALRAADLGADALGFVFAPKSRRRADPEVAAQVAREAPPFVTLVGVFLDQPPEEVLALARACRLGLVQLHGTEDAAYAARLGVRVLKAVSLAGPEDLEALKAFPEATAFLLDSAVGGERGGTGACFDWSWAVQAKRYGRIVLAGGLHPDNVEAAIRSVRPWAVDVCTGTEASPGIKDPAKVRDFISRVRRASELHPFDFEEAQASRPRAGARKRRGRRDLETA